MMMILDFFTRLACKKALHFKNQARNKSNARKIKASRASRPVDPLPRLDSHIESVLQAITRLVPVADV